MKSHSGDPFFITDFQIFGDNCYKLVKYLVKHFLNKCCMTHLLKSLCDFKTKSKLNVSIKLVLFKKKCFDLAIYNKIFLGFTKVLSQIHNFVLCKFHVKCNLIASCFFMTMKLNYFFSIKVQNFWMKLHVSLNENIFPLIKRVRHLPEFRDFLLLEVLVIYLS